MGTFIGINKKGHGELIPLPSMGVFRGGICSRDIRLRLDLAKSPFGPDDSDFREAIKKQYVTLLRFLIEIGLREELVIKGKIRIYLRNLCFLSKEPETAGELARLDIG